MARNQTITFASVKKALIMAGLNDLARDLSELDDDPNRPATLQELEELRIGMGIRSQEDAYKATIQWSSDSLLRMDTGVRTAICQILIELCTKYRVETPNSWRDMIANPSKWDTWRDEDKAVLIEDEDAENIFQTGPTFNPGHK